jgi:hypothetical protein
MMHKGQPIATAPRDGRTVIVWAEDEPEIPMRWVADGTNPLVQSSLGIWETPGGSMTWSEASGYGPTHWRPLDA